MESRPKLNGHAADWPEVAFDCSPMRVSALALGSIALSSVGATFAFGYFPAVEPWSGWIVGWAALIFFGGCAFLLLKQVRVCGAVITAGPAGVARYPLVAGLDTADGHHRPLGASINGTHFLMLQIDPAFEASMPLTRLARWAKPANAALGYHGYGISAAGLSGSFEVLRQAIEEGWARSRSG